MPEPNLPPLRLTNQHLSSENSNILNINKYRENLPEMPRITRSKLLDNYKLSADHAYRLLEDRDLLKYFEETLSILKKNTSDDESIRYAKMACQILFCDLENIRNKWQSLNLTELYVKPKHIARAAQMRTNRELSTNLIKEALDLIMAEEKYRDASLDDIISQQGWLGSFRDNERITMIVEEAIKDHKKLVGKYIRGNTKGFDTIVRNIFKKHGSDIDPNMVRKTLRSQLEHMKQQAQ